LEGVSTSRIDKIEPSHIRIIELNGIASMVMSNYANNKDLYEIWCSNWAHWRILWNISRENLRRGVKTMSLSEAWNIVQMMKSLKFKEGDW